MGVNIEIKYNNDISILEIAKLKNLSFGISNDHYVLERGEIAQTTILYDSKCIGRGFEVTLEEDLIYLRLPLPTTAHEIELFYELVKDICIKCNLSYFVRDEGIVPIENALDYIESDKEASLNAIKNIDQRIRSNEMSRMMIFGALNPISLGIGQMNEINQSLEGFESFLNRLQQIDAFYATPHYYRREDGSIFGVYFVGEEIVSIVPLNPKSPFHNIENLDSYYVRIPDQNAIPYDDFINHVESIEDYDNDHMIISLSEDKIYELSDHYSEDMFTKEKVNGVYFGKILDNGRNHLRKIRNLKLPIEELAAFNHLAIFLRWMSEHDLLSEQLINDIPNIKEIITNKNIDLRQMIIQNPVFNCELKVNHFNEIGKDFARKYYTFGQDGYPSDVDKYTIEVFGIEKYNSEEFKNEAYLFTPYNEDYYQGLSKYIEIAWNKYKA